MSRSYLLLAVLVGVSVCFPQIAGASILYQEDFSSVSGTLAEGDGASWTKLTGDPLYYFGPLGTTAAVDSSGTYANVLTIDATNASAGACGQVRYWPSPAFDASKGPLTVSADVGGDCSAGAGWQNADLWLGNVHLQSWPGCGQCQLTVSGTSISSMTSGYPAKTLGDLYNASLTLTPNGSLYDIAYACDGYGTTVTGVTAAQIGSLGEIGFSGQSSAAWKLYIDNISVSQVPEPAAIGMCVSGALALLAYAWRRRK